MKTPLTRTILREWLNTVEASPKNVHLVDEFVREQSDAGRRIGLVVDLCNHECLYSEELPESVQYEHLWCVAKEVPGDVLVQKFVGIVRDFLERRPNEYISVHCAYGFNRTGFMICCYLIQVLNYSIAGAMDAFSESRPPGIKHEKFKQALEMRYSHLQNDAASVGGNVDGRGPPFDENMEESLMTLDVTSGKELLHQLREYKSSEDLSEASPNKGGKQAHIRPHQASAPRGQTGGCVIL